MVGLVLALLATVGRAGVHYSGEAFAELPSQWRGFLLDQRTLRQISAPAGPRTPPSPLRLRYQEEAAKLEAKKEQLNADELADLGAIYLRLGENGKALTVLRAGQRKSPEHFRVLANLGTAWQMQGDLAMAAETLQAAVRLAPPRFRKSEQLHLKLVRQRLKEGSRHQGLDDLFGVTFVGPGGDYHPGRWSEQQRRQLPAGAVGLLQQLALWLPADARLLWQLAELASAHGDVRTAAAMMDGCVTQFGLDDPLLRRHRQLMRAAADKLPRGTLDAKAPHQQHVGSLATRSRRPLLGRLDRSDLPPISSSGVNSLPWDVLAQTVIGAGSRPSFARYLQDLDGKQVALTGFMQPLKEEQEVTAFLFIEFPVGCWYCEMPETASIIWVELPEGKSVPYRRDLVRVVGRLQLNASDPEDFVYAIRNARVTEVD
jgi:hypothetical protein